MKEFNFDELAREVRILQEGLETYKECQNDPKCDKLGLGFNLSRECSSIKISVSLDSWKGFYGSNSCSTILGSLGDVFEHYFKKYLNKHKIEILEEIIEMIKKDIKGKAKQKIAELESQINNIREKYLEGE